MTPAEVLRTLRRFLLSLSLLIFAGTMVELWLVSHYQDVIQILAFVFGGLGCLTVLIAILRLQRATLWLLRISQIVIALGSLYGIYEHVAGNIAFAREIHPNAPFAEVFAKGFTGANPLLAPGAFTVAALLALAATYRYWSTNNVPDAN